MRTVTVTFFLLIVVFHTNAASYYFSSSTGNDDHTSKQAQNQSTPWKSLNKLNTIFSSLAPGDAVYFKRGDVFNGYIIVSGSGRAGAPILLSAYGTGNKPVINGLATLSGWVSVGGNVYETPVNSGATLNMVTLNDQVQAMGRHPNSNSTNGGYLTIDSHNGTQSITDAALPSSPGWTGAELVMRKADWVLDRSSITNHSGNTITYSSSTGNQPINGNGYFIQNSAATLDRHGEWYYNPAQSKLRLYSTVNPATIAVKAGIYDVLIAVSNRSFITFDNLSLQGADKESFQLQQSNHITIQNCTLRYTGFDAIAATSSSRITIYNCSIDYSGNSGIRTGSGCSRSLIRKNTVNHSGVIAGMGLSNNQQMVGIFAGDGATLNVIDSNVVRNSGYCGITFTGDSTLVKNNYVDSFCLTVNDGGGIYTWGGFDKAARKITGNIVLNGFGQPYGTGSSTPGGAVGIYVDDRSANIDIQNNTIAHNSRSGIFLHNSHEISITGNTFFNNATQLSLTHDAAEPADPIRNVLISKNIFFSKVPGQKLMENGSVTNDISQFGTLNDNYYMSPFDRNGIITVNYKNGNQGTAYADYDLTGWSSAYGKDTKSQESPVEIVPYQISGKSDLNKFSNGTFTNDIKGATCFNAANCIISWSAAGQLDGSAIKIASNSNSTNSVYVYFEIGSINAGSNYHITFSTRGSLNNKTIKAYIRNDSYKTISPVKYFSTGTSRRENEFLYTARTASGTAYLVLELTEKDGPVWIDNLNIRTGNAVVTNPDEYILFDYNKGNIPKTVMLNGTYIDAKSNKHQKSITLAPFTSTVLIKQGAKSKSR